MSQTTAEEVQQIAVKAIKRLKRKNKALKREAKDWEQNYVTESDDNLRLRRENSRLVKGGVITVALFLLSRGLSRW